MTELEIKLALKLETGCRFAWCTRRAVNGGRGASRIRDTLTMVNAGEEIGTMIAGAVVHPLITVARKMQKFCRYFRSPLALVSGVWKGEEIKNSRMEERFGRIGGIHRKGKHLQIRDNWEEGF